MEEKPAEQPTRPAARDFSVGEFRAFPLQFNGATPMMGLPAIYGTQEQAKRHVGGWHAERMSIGPAIARLTLRHAQFYVVKGHNCHVKRGA